MKNQLEAKPITEDDLPGLSIDMLCNLALRYNPLSKKEIKSDYNSLKAHPKDSSAKSEFIEKYLTFRH